MGSLCPKTRNKEKKVSLKVLPETRQIEPVYEARMVPKMVDCSKRENLYDKRTTLLKDEIILEKLINFLKLIATSNQPNQANVKNVYYNYDTYVIEFTPDESESNTINPNILAHPMPGKTTQQHNVWRVGVLVLMLLYEFDDKSIDYLCNELRAKRLIKFDTFKNLNTPSSIDFIECFCYYTESDQESFLELLTKL
jgi:hypothetical protein